MISRQYEIELKESLLALIEIESSFKYEFHFTLIHILIFYTIITIIHTN